MITPSLFTKTLGPHEQVVIRDLTVKKAPDARRLGQYRPTAFEPSAVRDRLPRERALKLHRDGKKAIITARNIANILHARVYVVHFNGENFLCNEVEKNAFIKVPGKAVTVHTVKAAWEDKAQYHKE